MSKTRVVNLRKEKYDVYIGRAGRGEEGFFGNPFPLPYAASDAERARVLERYKRFFDEKIKSDPEFKKRILALKGKTLGCFCKPKACHGDVIVEFLEKENEIV